MILYGTIKGRGMKMYGTMRGRVLILYGTMRGRAIETVCHHARAIRVYGTIRWGGGA